VFGYMIEGEMLFELKAKPLGLFGLEKHSGNPAEKWCTTRMPTTATISAANLSSR